MTCLQGFRRAESVAAPLKTHFQGVRQDPIIFQSAIHPTIHSSIISLNQIPPKDPCRTHSLGRSSTVLRESLSEHLVYLMRPSLLLWSWNGLDETILDFMYSSQIVSCGIPNTTFEDRSAGLTRSEQAPSSIRRGTLFVPRQLLRSCPRHFNRPFS